jgi:hypothetical protein
LRRNITSYAATIGRRCHLDPKKVELFLQAVDDTLEDILLLLLGYRNTERSFTNDWMKVEEIVNFVAKQQCVRARGIATRSDVDLILAPKAPVVAPRKYSSKLATSM